MKYEIVRVNTRGVSKAKEGRRLHWTPGACSCCKMLCFAKCNEGVAATYREEAQTLPLCPAWLKPADF